MLKGRLPEQRESLLGNPKRSDSVWSKRVRCLVCCLELLFLLLALYLSFVFGHHFYSFYSETGFPQACTVEGKKSFPFCDVSLSSDKRLNDLVSRVTLADAGRQLTARESPELPDLGLPSYYWGTNAIHGLQNVKCLKHGHCPTAFPAPVSLGATFDMELVREMGEILGNELRAYYNAGEHNSLDTWSPTININRDPRWGRNVEAPSEDPLLNGLYGIAYTRGLQEGPEYPDVIKAVVTLKHWFAYSLEHYQHVNRMTYDAKITAHDLAATYFMPWEYTVKGSNPLGIMCSYNMVNGKPTCANPTTYALLQSWGFKGYITSDTDACGNIYTTHKYVATAEEAIQLCLEGDTHIDSGNTYKRYLTSGVEKGIVKKSLVDHALYKSYEARLRVGLFDGEHQTNSYTKIPATEVGKDANIEKSIHAARKSMVLLKNEDQTLPFPKGKTVAVIGDGINAASTLLGNYNGPLCRSGGSRCLASLVDKIKDVNEDGKTLSFDNASNITTARKVASSADYIIMVINNAHDGGGEGSDRKHITLAKEQKSLAKAMLKLGKPIVLVMVNGGVIAIDELASDFPAILEAFMPGAHGAVAVAETIFGDNNPGGKMPVTLFPSSYVNEVDFLNMSMQAGSGRTYRYYTGKPIFEFGYGLSYTDFEMSWQSGNACSFVGDLKETCVFTVVLKNVGKVAGDEVVQVYMKPQRSTLVSLALETPLPLKQLIYFKRVSLEAGAMTILKIPVTAKELGLVDLEGNRKLQPGVYNLEFTRGHGEMLSTSVKVVADVPVMIQPFVKPWW